MNNNKQVLRRMQSIPMFKAVRFLNPRGCDRIMDLMNTTGSESPDVTGVINLIAALAKVKPVEAREKLNKLLEKLERTFAKTSFNFILKGIPDAAPVRDTGIVETIGYPHMRDTLGQFGKFTNMQIIRGNVYVKFAEPSSCVVCHSLINNMEMGGKVVKTECV